MGSYIKKYIVLYGYGIVIKHTFQRKMIWTIMMANILLLGIMWIGKEMTLRLIKKMTKLVSIKFVFKKEGVNRRHTCTRRVGRIQLRRISNRPPSRRSNRVNLSRRSAPSNRVNLGRRRAPPHYNDIETEISEAVRLINIDLAKQEME